MTDRQHLPEPVIVRLPAEIDVAKAEYVSELLRSAFTPGVTVGDRGLDPDRVFTTRRGACQFVMAHQYADAPGALVRFVVPDRNLLRVLKVTPWTSCFRPGFGGQR